jgi:hypothetical protein
MKEEIFHAIIKNGDMLGIAVIDNNGNEFFLLDSSIVDNRSDGIVWHRPHLLAGKYTVVVTISGENFSEISKVYEIQNLKDERLIFKEKEDSKEWLRKIEDDKKKLAKMWSSVY